MVARKEAAYDILIICWGMRIQTHKVAALQKDGRIAVRLPDDAVNPLLRASCKYLSRLARLMMYHGSHTPVRLEIGASS